MNRQGWCVAGVAGLALMMGCGKPVAVPLEKVQVTPVKADELMRLVHEPGAKVVLVNLWATWCPPCRVEFPNLVKLARNYQGRGVRVLLVSADADAELLNVKKFLAKQGVDFPSYLKAQKDQEFIDGVYPKWDGALPATLVYDGHGNLSTFWEGETSYAVFEEKVLEVLNK